jgi:hypothetical protein
VFVAGDGLLHQRWVAFDERAAA